MQDRVSLYPGRVKLEPVAGQANTYDLTRADQPTQEGTPLNKASLLKDATAELFGLDANAVPDDALALLSRFQNGLGNEYLWSKSNDTGIVGYVNSPAPNAYPPSVSDGYTYKALGQLGVKVRIETGSYTGTGSTTKKLTFSFNPEFVFVYKIDSNSYGLVPSMDGWKQHGIIFCRYQDKYWFDGNKYPDISFKNNTLEMSNASAADQVYNISGQNYRYIAVG